MAVSKPNKVTSSEDFVWVSKFDAVAVKEFYHEFARLESDPDVTIIPIIIASYGGDVHHQLAMRDLIKSSSKPVATIAFGVAMSAGAALLASGSKGYRYASPDAGIMVHEVSTGWNGKTTDFVAEAKYLDYLNKLFIQRIAEDSGRTLEDFLKKIESLKNADWTMTAKEAKQWGIIDHIGVPRRHSRAAITGLVIPGQGKNKKVKKKS
jgi:ATP-dependent Clp protease protease subunit